MRKFRLRKYCYLVLWLGLAAAVAGVWFLGGKGQQESSPSSSAPQAGPVTLSPQEEDEPLVGVWVSYFSLAAPEGTWVRKTQQNLKERLRIRHIAASHAFDLARRYLTGLEMK